MFAIVGPPGSAMSCSPQVSVPCRRAAWTRWTYPSGNAGWSGRPPIGPSGMVSAPDGPDAAGVKPVPLP
ncbi:hypothetical protein ACQSSU_22475 [Micromonospora echinospora]